MSIFLFRRRTALRFFYALFFIGFLANSNVLFAQDHTLTICSGQSIGFAPPGNPSSFTYTWAVPVITPAGAVNATPQATPQPSVNQTLTNNTAAPATVLYTVSVSNATTFTLEVTVNPRPTLSNSTATTSICSGATFSFTNSSATTGTAFSWSRALTSGISPNTSSGTGNISEALTNSTTNTLTATYIVQLTANGCVNTQNISVNVNPLPQLTSSLTPPSVCSGSNFAYTPVANQSNTSLAWSRATVAGISNGAATGVNNPNEILLNTTLSAVTVNYVYTLSNTATGCTNTQTVTTNVNPLPTLSSSTSNVAICSGASFTYSPSSALGGTAITWTRAAVTGISPNSGLGNGNVTEVLVNNSNTVARTVTYQFTLSNSGCVNNQSFTVTVNPSPTLSSTLLPAGVCSGNPFNYTPTSLQSNIGFAWSRAAVAGISNGAATGSGNPNETLNNTTLASINVTYSYTLTNSVTTCSNTENVVVAINPVPNIAGPIDINVCNDKGFAYYPTGAPIGTTYTWTTPTITPNGAITNGTAQSTGLPYIGQQLLNTSGAVARASYVVTPNTFGCSGPTFILNADVATTITPNILLTSTTSPAAVCSGTPFNYIATSNEAGATYEWRRFFNSGINNAENTNNSNIINETLVNNTTGPVTVSYAIYITASGCTNSQVINLQVNPATALSSSLTPSAICSNNTFNYTPTSNTPTTNQFSWTRAVVAGISNATASGLNNPAEVLINTTTAPVNVTYQYTLITSSGCTNTQNVVVAVNPTPSLSTTLTPAAVCSGNTFTYNPASTPGGGLFSWARSAITGIANAAGNGVGNASEILVNTTLNPITVVYNYTSTVNGCSNTQAVNVVVKPVPVVANQTAAICSGGTFSVAISGVPTGTQYTWPLPVSVPSAVVTNGTAATLSNSISQTLQNLNTQQGILYYTITPSADGCNGLAFTAAVTVNPIPVATDQTVTAICSGTAFSYAPAIITSGTTYSWGNPIASPAGAVSGGSAQSAQATIGQTLTNLTNNSATIAYTVTPTANGCTGNNFIVTVPVNPVAVIGTQNVAVCSGNSFSVIPSPVPAGTSYTWTTPTIVPNGTIAGSIAQATPVNSISQLVTNTSTVPAQSAYTITPLSGSCAGNTFTLNLTVNPSTSLSSTLLPAAVCSNNTFSYLPTSNTASTNSFNWTRATVAGIVNAAASGANGINETLINNTSNPITVTYVYNLATTAGCTASQNVSVVINPTPVLSSVLTAASICSGNTFNYFASSNVAGTVFNWSRTQQISITNAAASGTGNPGEVLVNSSVNTVSVAYTYTLTANGCANQQTVTVPVKPTPVISNQAISTCSNTAFSVPLSNIPSNTQFSWLTPVYNPGASISGGSSQATNTSVLSQVLSNQTLNSAVASYTVTPVADGCSGNPFTLEVSVQPVPVIANQTLSNVCSGTPFSFAATNVPSGTTYTWLNPLVAPVNSLTGGSAQNTGVAQVSQTLVSTNNSTNNASYVVTPSANGCSGNNFTLSVTVNPTPVVANVRDTICTGNNFSVTLSAVPAGTTYTWGIPVATPSGSINGAVAQTVPATSISQLLNNTTNNPASLQYTVIPAAGNCSGTPFSVTVLVNPSTQLSSSLTPAAICSNSGFGYIPTSNTPSTSVFNWTRAAITGISNNATSGVNSINEILVNTTNTPIAVTYVYQLATTEGCTNTQSVTVTVNPTPTLSSVTNANAICSGSAFNYFPASGVAGTTFSWSRAQQVFISNGPANGIGNPSEILVNTSVNTAPVLYAYLLTANGCSNQQTVTVPVLATPTVAAQSVITCSNTGFSFSAANVPANTLYTWTSPVDNPGGTISGGSAQTTGVSSVSQVLTNQTLNTATAVYSVTPISGSCAGSAFTLSVNVRPVPVVPAQTSTQVCSGSPFNFTATNVPAGTTYTWFNPMIMPANSLNGGSAQSVGQNSVSQTLSSTNNLVNTAAYIVTPNANGCTGNSFTLSVTVNPTPAVNNIIDTICTGQTVSILPGNVPSNTLYTWPNPIVQPFGSVLGTTTQVLPSGNITQSLINTTTNPARVNYTITPVAGACTGSPFQLTVHVGAQLPVIQNQSAEICSGAAFNVTPANVPNGTRYTWTINSVLPAGTVTGMASVNAPQNTISQVLNNISGNNSIVSYAVTASNTGCSSNTFTASITVLPVPRITISGDDDICRYPLDTISLRFTGGAPWSFSYIVDNGPLQNITNITTNPYLLISAASPLSSRSFRFTNIQHGACLNTNDTSSFSQIIRSLPRGTMNSRRGIYLCNNISDTLFITSPERLSYQWIRNGADVNGATDDSLVTGLPGRYNSYLMNEFGCRDTLAQGITLIKIDQPILNFAYDTYCINIPMNFTNLTDTNTTGPIIWNWNFGNGNIQNGYNAQNIYTVGGNHEIRLTANQVYCPITPTRMDSIIDIQIPIPGITMPSVTAHKSVPLPIDVRLLQGYTYRWTPSWGINRPNDRSVLFNYTTTQQYAIELISPAGCITRDSLLVRVFNDKLYDILVPKSFTPNGDGTNDKLYPYLAGISEMKYFRIYNRFNQLMFETRNHDEGWNGTVNGVPQPMGIYIWVAVGTAFDGSMVQKQGQTLLLR